MITNVMRARLLVLMILTAVSCFSADPFRDDFSHFPPGWLTSPEGALNGAIQEYHYLPNRSVPLGPWANAIGHLDAWVVGSEKGSHISRSNSIPRRANGHLRYSLPATRNGATTASK